MNQDKNYIEKIINDYCNKDNTKIMQLKKLDSKAKKLPTIFAYTFGMLSCLTFGLSMSIVLSNNNTQKQVFIIGAVIGVIGVILMCLNYPIYNKVLKKNKDKYASLIVKLASDICKDE